MIAEARVLALIAARGGSKGLPRKNVLHLGGKPLIAWTIEAARSSRFIDRTVLSSDDDEIMLVARQWGCEVPFVRPAHLAGDEADSIDVVRHALSALAADPFEYIVLLQPTSPMRNATDIDATISLCAQRGVTSAVSVCAVDKTPYWMFKKAPDDRLLPLLPASERPSNRQAAPPVFLLNGAVYVSKVSHIMGGGGFLADDTLAYEMDKARSVDIDTREDLEILESRVRQDHAQI